ncbi:restriction endonuclease FokI C-terminal domain-containing protein [Orbus wheelerorum]|uniref:restriction endonuclease FokI C-terminal domain-containing protein n=1 Tax=Orbus wheelerorum TaxID=3074111 RepID=UPI00370DC01E
MKTRTYGWVQNPSSFSNLKKIVQIFDINSPHYQDLKLNLLKNIYFTNIKAELQKKFDKNVKVFSYVELVGTSKNKLGKSPKNRQDAVANSIIQVSITPQQAKKTGKTWTDNWTSDGFLRWAVSLNFIKVDIKKDIFSITENGLSFSQSTSGSSEETGILQIALLAYPPATQILSLLDSANQYCTKYYLGANLGFRGEKGFTSYNEDIMFDWLNSADNKEKKKIKSDVEGTSDKYARGICNWLKNVGFVKTGAAKKIFSDGKEEKFQGYKITGKGLSALRRSQGSSKNKQIEKFVMWEFFATDGQNRDYVRARRAFIVKFLTKPIILKQLIKKLGEKGFHDSQEIIESDIQGLKYFGLRIEQKNDKLFLLDKINNFHIPDLNFTRELKNDQIEKRKEKFLKITSLPMKYIELLEIAYDGKRNRDFEIVTIELFKEIYKINAKLLGGSRKPDGLIFDQNFGVIIDTKAYSNGYTKNIAQADEMIRYIEDNRRKCKTRNPNCWWENFPADIPKNNYYFLWISSKFINNFNEQLIYTANQTETKGAALNVEQLLLGAAAIMKGNIAISNLINYFDNKEILFADSPISS